MAAALGAEMLTDRELEVLRQIAVGLTTAQAAEQLEISPHTAHTHLKHIYDKLGISTRGQLVLFAARSGLIDY